MSAQALRLEPSWKARVGSYFDRPDMQALSAFLRAELRAGKAIYPPPQRIFAALDSTPFDKVKVVILGQDPYHGPGQAHGLCFSVQPGVRVPPSLVNIYKELERDLGLPRPAHGDLSGWAHQGVLLLNRALTYERGIPGRDQHFRCMMVYEEALRRMPDKCPPIEHPQYQTRFRTLQCIAVAYARHPERFGVVKLWLPDAWLERTIDGARGSASPQSGQQAGT